MLTLLFAVFVVLFALKDSGEKSQDAAGSLEESFNKPLDDIPPAHMIGPGAKDFGVFENAKGTSVKAPLVKKFPDTTQPVKIIDNDLNKVKGQLEERLYGSQKHRKKHDPGHARIYDIERTKTGFKVRLLARHFYKKGAVKVKRKALKDLDHVVKVVKDLGRDVRVEGHADGLKYGNKSKWDVSALRATNVLKYMVKHHNFPPTRLSAAGYGDTKPMASNATEQGRAMNRRIEFNISYDDETSLDGQ